MYCLTAKRDYERLCSEEKEVAKRRKAAGRVFAQARKDIMGSMPVPDDSDDAE